MAANPGPTERSQQEWVNEQLRCRGEHATFVQIQPSRYRLLTVVVAIFGELTDGAVEVLQELHQKHRPYGFLYTYMTIGNLWTTLK